MKTKKKTLVVAAKKRKTAGKRHISPTKKRKGKLIVIDGTDGSGKATQVQLLIERLKKEGIRAKSIDFPRYTGNLLGGLIRECLDGKRGDFLATDARVASVLYAADRYESSAQIHKWLNDGVHVIADRYASSNQLHQGGKIADPAERRIFLEWLDRLEHSVFKIPRPNKIVYLHVPIEVSRGLIERRAAATGKAPDQAESNTRHLADAQGSALLIVKEKNNWVKIECAVDGIILPKEEISQLIFQQIKRLV